MQLHDVIAYSFHPDLLDASDKKLKSFLLVLTAHYPKQIRAKDTKDEYIETNYDNKELLSAWRAAHSNVVVILTSRQLKFRHYTLVFLSFVTALVLSVTLILKLQSKSYTGEKMSELHKQVIPKHSCDKLHHP